MKKISCSIYLLPALCLLSLVSFSQPKLEFRAAWIATVSNIDWPTKGNYNTDSQKVEFISILDMHYKNGMNAVIVQIRPATDAFYPSQFEPWSEWLTGTQGKPPLPYYDPLQFMIEETHKRGMEFHAWCNPYRAEFLVGKSSIAPSHITKIHPEWFLTYGGKKYFDPGNKESQNFVVLVIQDIVNRYDIDAVHFDDYFYPYRIAGREFPDSMSFAQHGRGMNKEDWRRSNVDSIILNLNRTIKEQNKYCRFGISPFGVWRNKDQDPDGSDTKAGQTNYDDLYANVLLWLKNGWIDYVAPQLYWEIGHPRAPYEVLLDWWSKHTFGKHCYIGLGIYRAGSSEPWKDSTMIPRQIQALRSYPEVQGAIYFSSKSFIRNPNGWSDSLQNNYYRYPALIPPMKWLDNVKPGKPLIRARNSSTKNSFELEIKTSNQFKKIKEFVVYAFNDSDPVKDPGNPANIFKVIVSDVETKVDLPSNLGKQFAVSCVDVNNNESELSFVRFR